jgi:hypothetical protein
MVGVRAKPIIGSFYRPVIDEIIALTGPSGVATVECCVIKIGILTALRIIEVLGHPVGDILRNVTGETPDIQLNV